MNATKTSGNFLIAMVIGWAWVAIPLAWGIWQTLIKTMDLFK